MAETIYEYTKTINSDKLKSEVEALELSHTLLRIDTVGTQVFLVFDDELGETDEDALEAAVSAHIPVTTAESLQAYLSASVFPFVQTVVTQIAAENIAMGITQAGKTADVLGLFGKQFDIGATYPVSLKDTFDSGSLYVSLAVLQHMRDNPSVYDGLSPYITDARLLATKNKIEVFLGVTPLST